MNEKGLRVLEYNKIITKLVSFAGSSMAKERLEKLTPSNDITDILEGLKETTEAQTVILAKGNCPVGEIYDIEPLLYLARKGGSLTMKDLLHVLYNMKVASNVKSFLSSELPPLTIIDAINEVIAVFPKLVEKIDKSILSEDEMADTASPELRTIRREIVRQNEAIRAKLNNIIGGENKAFLQDSIVTMRDGRYVVPVKADHRAKINGIVHDQSASGQTLFIEPQVIVDLNNKLRELEIAEEKEIARILLELSGNVAEHFHDLLNNQKLLVDLDVMFAKGKLSCSMDGAEPNISPDGKLSLIKARHPLIDKEKVVPINVEIGGSFKTLVITGPNTGGKTVTLKTIGLLSMMAESGLHIPASERSVIPIYDEIYADIGDEQSIEQNLSTFSSHMKNTVNIVAKADEKSLVLLDELGAGTDPTEGAALAISILERLRSDGATAVATTHYTELKKYAISTDGVENASMEFDVETLSPTYRLMIGVPGKSNAFEISKKLGLPLDIIERASTLIERGDIEFEDVITKIDDDRKQAENLKIESEKIYDELSRREADLKKREADLQKKIEEAIASAKEEARGIIREAKETASDVQKELNKLSRNQSLGERNSLISDAKKRLNESEKKYQTGLISEFNENPISIEDIKIGERVQVLSIGQEGEILSLPDDKGEIVVKCGILKTRVSVDDLMYLGKDFVSQKSEKSKKGYSGISKSKAMNVSTSVNVIGKNLDDALVIVEKYLDDCYIAGLKEVTVIHGRGEGILQSGIRAALRKNKLVASYQKGGYHDGGDGVTVVKFKEK